MVKMLARLTSVAKIACILHQSVEIYPINSSVSLRTSRRPSVLTLGRLIVRDSLEAIRLHKLTQRFAAHVCLELNSVQSSYNSPHTCAL